MQLDYSRCIRWYKLCFEYAGYEVLEASDGRLAAETAKKEGIYNSKIIYRDLPVVVGARFLIKGLDSALLGLNVGDKKTVEVKVDSATKSAVEKIEGIQKTSFSGVADGPADDKEV